MQYSPKLKMAMEEIKAIIKKHDVGAIVVLHSPGHCEYLNALEPSYSCVKIENGGKVILKTKSTHYNGDKKKRDEIATATSNMLSALGTVGGRLSMNVLELSKVLDEHINAEHTDGGHTSHDQQNN